MKCTNCGSNVLSGAKFCENCGMAMAVQTAEPKREESKEIPSVTAIAPNTTKMIPRWFVIVSMVLSLLTAIGIVGLFIPAITLDPLTYAIIVLSATVGLSTIFYLFMLILFLAKRYGHGSKLIPLLHIILYVVGGIGLAIASSFLYQKQIAIAMLGLASGVSFVMLCVGLYFLLREHGEE